MEKNQVLDVSWETVIKIFIAIFILYIIYITRQIFLWFFFGLAISVLLEPAINFLRKLRIPKIFAIVIIYFSIFGIVGLLIYLTAPIFISELKQFSNYLPEYFERINPVLRQLGIDTARSFTDLTKFLMGGLEQGSESILGAVISFLGGVSSAIFILTMAFFLSLENNGVEKFLTLVLPKKYEDHVTIFFERAQLKVTRWFGARLLACLFVGLASFIVFYIFGIDYALLLALISGVLNFVPYIGPWITAITLAIFVGVSSPTPIIIIYVLAAVLAIQAIENNLLTPILMKKMIDFPPVLVLISLLAGAKIFGFLGMLFAIPVFGIIYEFVKEFLEKRKENLSVVNDY